MCYKSQINYMECDGFFFNRIGIIRDTKSVKWPIEMCSFLKCVNINITIANDKWDRVYRTYVTNTNSSRL